MSRLLGRVRQDHVGPLFLGLAILGVLVAALVAPVGP